jgi:hypothetical protein
MIPMSLERRTSPRIVALAALVLTLLGLTVAAQGGFTVAGRLGATDQEAQEGYFAIDPQTMIVVKPGSEIHAFLQGKVGQRVRVTIEPDAESE